jgi:hypothetical protein
MPSPTVVGVALRDDSAPLALVTSYAYGAAIVRGCERLASMRERAERALGRAGHP